MKRIIVKNQMKKQNSNLISVKINLQMILFIKEILLSFIQFTITLDQIL